MWIVNLNIKAKAIKTLKDKKENVFMTLDRQKFFKQNTKSTNCKGKFDKLNYNKVGNFCLPKDTIKRGKGQATGWEKIFAIYLALKDSYPEYRKNSYKSIRKKWLSP